MTLFVQMGMPTIFTEDANLRDLLKSDEPLYVSHVIHKATIEINEQFTEASAVSGKTFYDCSMLEIWM